MAKMQRKKKDMSDVPELTLAGALSEVWFQLNYAAYNLAYVRVYSQSAALQTNVNELRDQEQAMQDNTQVDIVICRTHLASFFWYLDHVFEALETAIARGQKEHPVLPYFWECEKHLKVVEQYPIRQQIKVYRNMSHEIPAIIGCKWNSDGQFISHFLPVINGHKQDESADMITQLHRYFEFVSNIWFASGLADFKGKFPRDFKFPVTVPHTYIGDLPSELRGLPHLEISMVSYSVDKVGNRTEKDASV